MNLKQKKYRNKCFIFKEIRAGMQVGGTYLSYERLWAHHQKPQK